MSNDALIVGGGLQGCAIALFLARAGWRVTVVEKNLAGRHASGVNAGGLRSLMRAMDMWANLADVVGAAAAESCEIRLGTAQIALAMDAAELQWCEARSRTMRRRDIHSEELIAPDALHRLLPGLSGAALGGLISRRDGHANPANAARAFRKAAEATGVRILEQCKVHDLTPKPSGGWRAETDAGAIEAEWVVYCAGAWGSALAARRGESVPS